mmetsp:Transcript_16340/g.42095  ORF Transcript_16340/g.42095 Transcript_16340/m.42095 type:complete len:371 (+) Transcript_16340:44-1156(+)
MPNDREDPRDANPMFKRLPAEVVSRRRPQAMQQESMQVVAASVDLEQVLQRKPEGRAKWLAKALQQAQDGRLEVQSLYDIVSCQRFCEDLTDKVGRKMYRALHASSEVFSSKQRKILQKDCPLAQLYSATAWGEKDGDAEETSKAEAQANLMEDMMARCRDFVRFKQTERGERDKDGDAVGPVGADLVATAALAAVVAATSVADASPDDEAAAEAATPGERSGAAGAASVSAASRTDSPARRSDNLEKAKEQTPQNLAKKGKDRGRDINKNVRHTTAKEKQKRARRGKSSSTRSRSGRSRIRSSSSCSRSGRQRERTGADRKAPSGRKRGSSSSSSGESHRRSKTKTAKRKDRGSSSSASLRHDRKRRKK